MRPVIVPALLALVASAAVAAPADKPGHFVEPLTGVELEVPTGWKHKYDAEEAVLWVAGPGGFRVRVVATEEKVQASKKWAYRSYKHDGQAFKDRAAQFKAQRPKAGKQMGGRPTYAYAFVWKTNDGAIETARGYLGSGTSKEPGRHVHVHVLAYGTQEAFKALGGGLGKLLASVRWPAPISGDGPGPDDPGGTDVAFTGDTSPPDDPGYVPPEDEDPAAPPPVTTRNPDDVGDYDRGSLSGGLGAMASGGVSRDVARNQAFINASRVKRQVRTTKQREKAASYMGFFKKK